MSIAGTIRPDGRYQPELVITVEVGQRRFGLTALVDSGADFTLFPIEGFLAYGIQWDDLEELPDGQGQGVGENCTFTFRRLNGGFLRWGTETFKNGILIAEAGTFGIGLLGREDFFQTFNVSFERWREDPPSFDVKPYPRGLHLA